MSTHRALVSRNRRDKSMADHDKLEVLRPMFAKTGLGDALIFA